MGTERSVLLRRASPLAAVVVLLAPSSGHASSFSPDPPPGASGQAGLRPDPAPAAAPEPAPAAPTSALPAASAPVSVVRPVMRPVVPRVASPAQRRRPVSIERKRAPKARSLDVHALALPPVLVAPFVTTPLQRHPQAALAALALALAALTAGSGAGLVRAWSRH